MDKLETNIIDIIVRFAPWLAPIPTAYAVYVAALNVLHYTPFVAGAAGASVEIIGIASVATALEFWSYNQEKTSKQKQAPFMIALITCVFYLVAVLLLAVFVEVFPELARGAAVIFPLLSLTGALILGLRRDHNMRKQAYKDRKSAVKTSRQQIQPDTSNNRKLDGNNNEAQQARLRNREEAIDALLRIYQSKPELLNSPTRAGQTLGVSRQSINTYRKVLAERGEIKKNGSGWELQ